MKALVYYQYGSTDVLQFAEVQKPTLTDNEVLIKVVAAGVNAADGYKLSGKPFIARLDSGLLKPKHPILGQDVAGRVEAVGSKVTQFKPGDAVFGDLSGHGGGGFAEYVCAPEYLLALKPTNLSFEQAAAVPLAGVTALQGLRDKGKIQAGQKVVINGAAGGVGTFAVQLAKVFGADVTAICSARNLEKMRALGADHVIDYARENFTESRQIYDLIIAANGYHPISHYQRVLAPQGTYVVIGGTMRQIFQAMLLGGFMSKKGGKTFTNLMAKPNQADLVFLKGLLEAGKIAPVMDRCYPLSEAAEALKYVGTRHAQGKVIVMVAQDNAQ